MGKFGFVGPSYTAGSNVIADEECINFYAETIETPGAQAQRSYFGTPGLLTFATFPDGPVRGQCWTGSRLFVAASDTLYEVFADGTKIARMANTLDVFGGPVSIAFSNIELFIVAGGRGYCYSLAANTFNDVTALLAGAPVKVEFSDDYFIVAFAGDNKFQMSGILDGNTWPGIQVNGVSVFPDNILSIIVSHRELWVFGSQHAQPYQNTGTDEVFDVIPGALIEMGIAAPFACNRVDNTVFWISQDERGARQAWRASGYTPSRISTHAVETALSSYSADQISNLTSYTYQDSGHLFWVLYIPGTDCTWVYDVAESLWAKRAEWHEDDGSWGPHRSCNHVYAFGKHLVGDWKAGNLWEMKLAVNNNDGTYSFVTDNGATIRRVRRSPTLVNEMEWVYHSQLTVDFATGLGLGPQPQPPVPIPAVLRSSATCADIGGFIRFFGAQVGDLAVLFCFAATGTITFDPSWTVYALGVGGAGNGFLISKILSDSDVGGVAYTQDSDPPFNRQINGMFCTGAAGGIREIQFTQGTTSPLSLTTVSSVAGDLAFYFGACRSSISNPTVGISRGTLRGNGSGNTVGSQFNWENFATGGPQTASFTSTGTPLDVFWAAVVVIASDINPGPGPALRPPQAMLRWSDNRGSTWSNQHFASLGFAGEYNTRVIWRRLGRSRYRVYELTVSDPIPIAIVDAYLRTS